MFASMKGQDEIIHPSISHEVTLIANYAFAVLLANLQTSQSTEHDSKAKMQPPIPYEVFFYQESFFLFYSQLLAEGIVCWCDNHNSTTLLLFQFMSHCHDMQIAETNKHLCVPLFINGNFYNALHW
jgi:hypothetical protein